MDGISVVIPCFNAARYLRASLDSVLAQDYPGPWEVLVADDGSSDGSDWIAESYGPPVRVLRSLLPAGRGCGAMRNLGIRAARFPLIALQDADDLWLPGHVAALWQALDANPEAALAYCNGRFMDANGIPFGPRLVYHDPPLDPNALLLSCCLLNPGVLVRKAVFDEVGLFDENLIYSQDHDMWLRVVERFPIVYTPHDGYLYRQHPDQSSKKGEAAWRFAGQVLRKAAARYPYRRSALRQRRGVIAYRRAEYACRSGRYLRAAYFLGQAALADPARAVRELIRRSRQVGHALALGVRGDAAQPLITDT